MKKLILGLVLFVVGFVVGGAVAQAPVTLEFWDMTWGPAEYIETAEGLVQQFEAEHPDIKIDYRSVPWNNWYQTFLVAVGSGTAPDVSTGGAFQPVQFYDVGAVMPVDDVIEAMRAEGTLDDYEPRVVEAYHYDGHYVAVPWSTGTRAWYYRKSMFEEAGLELPTTWDEFAAAAKALTKDGKYGLVAAGDTGGTQYLYSLMINNGGGLFTAEGEPNLMDERNIEALQFYSDLAKAGVIHPSSASISLTEANDVFARGDAAMILSGPGIAIQYPDIFDDIGVLPPIKGPHGDTGTFTSVAGIMVYTQTEHPDEAKTFVKWWAENEKPLWVDGNIGGNVPARKSFLDDPHFQDNTLMASIIKEYLPIGKYVGAQYPSFFPALNEVEGEGFMQTLTQDLLQGKDMTASLETAARTFDSVTKNLELGQ